MLSGIPALHSSFIQQSTKFSAYIIVIGNKILNKEPYIIIIANSVQSTRVKHNPHLVFPKTTDTMCSDFLAQYRADKTLWSLTPKLPKCRGWCAVKAVHRIAMSIFPADFWAQPPATSARWHWQCPSDTGAAVSHWLHLPGTRHGCLTGQRAFFGFCSVLERSSTPTESSHQKFILMLWSKPNAKLLFKRVTYFRQIWYSLKIYVRYSFNYILQDNKSIRLGLRGSVGCRHLLGITLIWHWYSVK